MIKLKAFTFGTIMYQYRSYRQERNYASINNILKVINYFTNSYFAFVWLIWQTHTYTEKYKCTQTHAHTDTDIIFTFYTLWIIWHTCQRY